MLIGFLRWLFFSLWSSRSWADRHPNTSQILKKLFSWSNSTLINNYWFRLFKFCIYFLNLRAINSVRMCKICAVYSRLSVSISSSSARMRFSRTLITSSFRSWLRSEFVGIRSVEVWAVVDERGVEKWVSECFVEVCTRVLFSRARGAWGVFGFFVKFVRCEVLLKLKTWMWEWIPNFTEADLIKEVHWTLYQTLMEWLQI
jgi:hypothetical protein